MSLLEKIYTEEHRIFRDALAKYFADNVTPYADEWEEKGIVPKQAWKDFGAQGFLCSWLPEEYGGSGVGFEYSIITLEEIAKTKQSGFAIGLHSDVVVPYIYTYGNEEQKKKWLPGCASGDIITAVAMTEPNTGSDLAAIKSTAVKKDGGYLINGQKTFISNGINCDLCIVAAKTDPKADPPYAGISLIVVEDGTPGFNKGQKFDKIGMKSQDTAEMFFEDCFVPAENLLGEEGAGFRYLMEKLQQERLFASWGSQVLAEEAMRVTLEYCRSREAFGRPISRFQHNSFKLAEMATDIELGRTFLEKLTMDHMEGKDVVKQVSMAKYWVCEMANRIVQNGVQLHGGYGYMEEYLIARLFRDVRVHTIYAGTTEIMKLIISRLMGL
ncbi:MAG: acyl-CoA dehydrogenase family protein [Deltaproteobacteria bacterium]|uniref:Acyl-CoA dehydrogenase family protein n=1 Tax=Candidatus Zymogenus saltonus TaxID=2844893 RepID=A0A9D8K8L7_9DELT|nr:acyl-CoA dehydrogenase family protein [Candidatus Zymogenus saltonus]